MTHFRNYCIVKLSRERGKAENGETVEPKSPGTVSASRCALMKGGKPDALQLPDIVTAAEAEQNGYVARLASQESNLNTLVFQNRDGSCTMRLYAHPVKYVTEGGETRDISLAMRQENTGDIVSADHGVETVFSPLMQNGIRLSYEDISLRMLPLLGDEGLSSGPSESVGAGATVRPMVRAELSPEGRTVRYTLDAVTSLEYELTYAGFKEDIVVREYTGQTEYRFLLQTGGLQLEQRRESLVLTDDGGTVRATLGDILVFTADERNNTRGELQFEPVRDGELYLLTVCLDADYLRDERTVYPIRIDPTLEVSYYTAGANAIEDVTLNSETDSDGSSTALFLGRRSYGAARVLMKFPGIDYGVLSSAVTIQSAYVEFRDLMCEAEELPVSCHRFTGNNWTESTAEWSNVDVNQYSAIPLSSHTISYANGINQPEGHWYRFPVRDAVVTWQLNAARRNQGLLFKTTDAIENGSSYLYKTIGSFNRSSNRPSIVITYGPRYSVAIQQSAASVYKFHTVQLSAVATPSGSQIVWVSNDRRIATVDALTGVVTGVAPGTAEIRAAVYDNTGLSIYSSPCTVTVSRRYETRSDSLLVGMSADDYLEADVKDKQGNSVKAQCSYGGRYSTRAANAFWGGIDSLKNDMTLKFYHFNKGNEHSFVHATKNDFISKEIDSSITELNIDDVDLMLFVGHGTAREGLHFSETPTGEHHISSLGDHKMPVFNFGIGEAKFGYGSARTKWVVTQTCNFLTHDLETLKPMMQGVNIVLGYEGTAYIDGNLMELFGQKLKDGEEIVEAWLSLKSYHDQYGLFPTTFKAVFVEDAEHDTISRYLVETGTYEQEVIRVKTASSMGNPELEGYGR